MSFGLTSTGFSPKTLTDIKSDLETALRSSFGASINLTPQSVFGQLVGIMAGALAEVWQAGESIYSAGDPDDAAADALDNIGAITGTVRLAAAVSAVTVRCAGTPGTVLSAGRVVSVSGTGVKFESTEDATIGGGGTVDVPFQSEETGTQVALTGSLTVIETPVAGWFSSTNLADAVLGRDEEPDSDYRARRESELRASGNAAVDAIRSNLLLVSGVTACTVFENPLDTVDANGLPAHSIECLVLGGADQDVLNEVWESKAAGIQTYGTTSGTVTDTSGISHTVKCSRPTTTNIYVIANVKIDPTVAPADAAARIQAAVLAKGNQSVIGLDVVASRLSAAAYSGSPGVLDISSLYIGTAPGPASSTTIAIDLRHLASFDSSRITVNLTNAVP